MSGQSNLIALALTCILVFTSCVSSPGKGNRRSTGGISNSPSSVSPGYGRILSDNPIILSNNYSLNAGVNLNRYLTSSQDFITNNQFLEDACDQSNLLITDCIEVRKNDNSVSALQSPSSKWAFQTNTDDWLQVQTFGHMMKATDRFHSSLGAAYTTSGILGYQSAFPTFFLDPFNPRPYSHWNTNSPLVAYANCGKADNAFFSPSTFSLCFGHDGNEPSVLFAQDSTIIYHEMGHAFIQVLLNIRNRDNSITPASSLGYLFYDEAGGVGEAISDYWSYVMTERTHIAEWGLGRFIDQSRPMSEDDPIHAPGISENNDSRLSYPTYVLYDPNFPNQPIEDVHYIGQILSHFLVAVTKSMASGCGWSTTNSINATNYLIYETFAELGDLTAQGSDVTSNYVNLNSAHALTWNSIANPINYRKFSQVFSKYMLLIYGKSGRTSCNGSNIDMDTYEQLLDSYGLLLFKNYNEDGGSLATGNSGTNTTITEANKVKTVMISKDLLKIDPTQGASTAFVFDNRAGMISSLSALQSSGQIGQLSDILESDLPFNNGNAAISPGEFLGIALNIYNDSNSPMAGVQILGNSWDHGKGDKPCGTFEDNFPSSSEGAADVTGETGTNPGECSYITRDNGDDAGESIEPVCMVQINDTNATKWAFQDKLKDQISLDNSNCLGGTGGNDKECFIRIVKGTEQATYSMLNPKSNWASTVFPDGNNIQFNFNNLIFMEVSPWVPPGTTFNCRFRARFTNCEDCWSRPGNADGDDYRDFEFSGGDPYKIINFEFVVID